MLPVFFHGIYTRLIFWEEKENGGIVMQIIITVNNRKIRTINIVRAQKTPTQLEGETFDYGWFTENPDATILSGQLRHSYDNGSDILAQKVLEEICNT